MNAVDYAKRDLQDSTAAYEVLEESAKQDPVRAGRTKAAGQVAMSIILPLPAMRNGIHDSLTAARKHHVVHDAAIYAARFAVFTAAHEEICNAGELFAS